jgi:hypothetical protein
MPMMPMLLRQPGGALAMAMAVSYLSQVAPVCRAGAEGAKPAKAAATEAVTFNKDIAPLVFHQCSFCHRPGEVAPFSLLSYRDVSKRAKLIQSVVHERSMPPWKATPDSGHFADERRLTDDQIALIDRWVENGTPEGDAASASPPPKFTEGWQTGEPDMILKMAEPYALAALGRDEYRCFVIPLKLPEGKYIKSVEYRPGNRKIVHHAVLTSMPHPQAEARLKRGDGKSFGSGLAPPGMLLPGPLAVWTPGMLSRPVPDEYAVDWRPGDDLVLQLHLHPSGKPETEQSLIGLHFSDKKPKGRLRLMTLSNDRIDIPPGESNHVVTLSRTLNNPLEVYGVFPHMHLIGRSVKVIAKLPDGTEKPVISINNWDFNWQFYYQYTTPLKLPAGTKLEGTWTFDNSADNPANPSDPPQRVRFGEQTTNEMAILLLDIIPTGPPPKPPTPEQMLKRAGDMIKRVDRDGDGKLDLAEITSLSGGFRAKEEIEKQILDFDTNGDKKLDAKELVEAFKGMTGR